MVKTARLQILMAIAAAFVVAVPAAARGTADSPDSTGGTVKVAQDSDPTKPIVFSVRDEYTRLKDGFSTNAFIFRFDRLVFKGLGVPGPIRGILTRLDLPIVTFSDPTGSETGLGDFYFQALVAPRIRGHFTIAGGTGLTLPTASSESLGKGKWILSPAIAPVWFFPPRGFGFIKFQDWFSVAGPSDRAKVHYLTVTAYALSRISKAWWVSLDAESNTNWLRDDETWYKSGFLVGRMLSNRMGIWVKGEIPFGQDYAADWTIKGSFFVTRY